MSKNLVKYAKVAIMVSVAAILGVEAYFIFPELQKYWPNRNNIQLEWFLGAIAFAAISMDSFAQVQRVLLRSAGIVVPQRESVAAIYAANSISMTVPGGPVLSTAFLYKRQREWGATPGIASWQLLIGGALQGIGLAVLGILGTGSLGTSGNKLSLAISLAGMLLLIAVGIFFSKSGTAAKSLIAGILRQVNVLFKRPADSGNDKVVNFFYQLESVELRKRNLASAFGWSIFNWISDIGCLLCACYATGSDISIAAVAVAYSASKVAGTATPWIPGGIGVVDVVLIAMLVSSGIPPAEAGLAVLVYRIVSLVLVTVAGWVIFLVKYRTLGGVRVPISS
ncbi:lysylphosphatidylglycerol synthase transmembrane domain-containing protein [Rhodococcus sp. OK302]|uniref:lysylphosphatidylglycerol synthase transmembrane domain-containing protein n=1 Tax=Rhodococcus sp. OK302 TaxID=1882769 RepID=UPI0015955DC7|nr:lysylphosphatidylglycerol synthase transmembrane domain-containing protein [Rhodococcus sp. OK302]